MINNKHLVLLTFFFITILSSAQRIEKESTNPFIIQNKKGFLITSIEEENKQHYIKLVQYDKDLKALDSLSQPVECSFYYSPKIENYGYEIMIGKDKFYKEGAILRIDTNLRKINFKEYTENDPAYLSMLAAAKENTDPANFYNINYSVMEIDDYGVRISKNKGFVFVKGYTRNQVELFQTYKQQWELNLPVKEEELNSYKFCSSYNDHLYLYTQGSSEMLHCFNYKTGKLMWSLKIQLKATKTLPFFSRMFVDKSDESIVITGGYFDTERPKKNVDETLKGYFILRADKSGKIISERSVALGNPKLSGKNKDFSDQKAICFLRIEKNEKGNYLLLAENIGLSHSAVRDKTTGLSDLMAGFRTYGFTRLEYDRDCQLVDSAFTEVENKYVNGSVSTDKDFVAIRDFLRYNENRSGWLSFVFCDRQLTNIIHQKPSETTFFMIKKENDTFSDINTKTRWGQARMFANAPSTTFFEGDDNSYYVFIPDKNKFIFEKRNY